jgi:vanillate/3-O-methylgallate O-demethylase
MDNLEAKLATYDRPVRMLREAPARRFRFPYPAQHTTWQHEQEAWRGSAVLFDQSHHMSDVYFKGPDVRRLLTETATNSFATFGRNRAKHLVTCNDLGQIIGTAVLFGLEEDEVNVVGPAASANWMQYHAEINGYDVEVVRDERTADNPGKRRTFRYQIEGPRAWEIVARAHGGPIEKAPFFRMIEFTLDGVPVRALVHTMVSEPGSETMGLEIWGPEAEAERCLEALLRAGEEDGLLRGGALAYYTGSVEAGYMAQPTAAIYSDPSLKAYREWLPADGYEGSLSLGGSFRSDDVEDYYFTPYDFGYGHLVRFDHDFIGHDALRQAAERPARRKVWLLWDEQEVARVYASSLFGGEHRAKFLDTPLARYARVHADAVLAGDDLTGLAAITGYTVTAGAWMSVAVVDPEHAVDGTELTLVWGEEDGGTAKQAVERHAQTSVRVRVSTVSPAQRG